MSSAIQEPKTDSSEKRSTPQERQAIVEGLKSCLSSLHPDTKQSIAERMVLSYTGSSDFPLRQTQEELLKFGRDIGVNNALTPNGEQNYGWLTEVAMEHMIQSIIEILSSASQRHQAGLFLENLKRLTKQSPAPNLHLAMVGLKLAAAILPPHEDESTLAQSPK